MEVKKVIQGINNTHNAHIVFDDGAEIIINAKKENSVVSSAGVFYDKKGENPFDLFTEEEISLAIDLAVDFLRDHE